MKYGSRGCSEILVTFGCRYLVQKHDEPAGSEMKTGTAGLSAEGALNKKGAVAGEYDLRISRKNVADTI